MKEKKPGRPKKRLAEKFGGQIAFNCHTKLIDRVEAYRISSGFHQRSDACRNLMEMALDSVDAADQAEDAVREQDQRKM